MADYDSDSSVENEDVSTSVLLGYASKEPTVDDFSQLGGQPTWLDGKTSPDGRLAKCKICNSVLCLLLQLNGDLPDRYPGHERRIYVFGCRRKACRRKAGSVRALRAMRTYGVSDGQSEGSSRVPAKEKQEPMANIGDTLFGVKPPTTAQANPFSSAQSSTAAANPFSTKQSSAAPTSESATNNLAETFAQKVQISSTPNEPITVSSSEPPAPWIEDPKPYTSYHLDADTEYLDPSFGSDDIPSAPQMETNGEDSSSAADDKALFESSMDKTFQRFADRLAQNPEQVLRYEHSGQPLLYSKSDAVGKLLAPVHDDAKVRISASRSHGSAAGQLRVPQCANCGAARVFELQLTPHAITELEADDPAIDGMEWGTIIMGACSRDCQQRGQPDGAIGYLEEWVGVQWEELADHRSQQ